VVAAGSNVGHVGFWVVDDDGDDAHRVFEYMPHLSSVGAIVAHAAKPHKVMFFLFLCSCTAYVLRVIEHFIYNLV
jgi:hypothetical protein